MVTTTVGLCCTSNAGAAGAVVQSRAFQRISFGGRDQDRRSIFHETRFWDSSRLTSMGT